MKEVKKLCWNCDGNVHMYELRCPYCGVELTSSEQNHSETPITPDTHEPHSASSEADFVPPYQSFEEEELTPTDEEWEEAIHEVPLTENTDCETLKPLILLLPGSIFFILGLALFLFSDEGVLTFHFNGKYWFVYLFASLPLLYLGLKLLFPVKKPFEKDQPTENQ